MLRIVWLLLPKRGLKLAIEDFKRYRKFVQGRKRSCWNEIRQGVRLKISQENTPYTAQISYRGRFLGMSSRFLFKEFEEIFVPISTFRELSGLKVKVSSGFNDLSSSPSSLGPLKISTLDGKHHLFPVTISGRIMGKNSHIYKLNDSLDESYLESEEVRVCSRYSYEESSPLKEWLGP